MSTLGSFVTEQASYLWSRLGLKTNDDLARVNIAKLAEETGEVAGAHLALLRHQRAETTKQPSTSTTPTRAPTPRR